MYKTVRHVARFQLDDSAALATYEDILNNPLCTIIREIREKLTNNTYGSEGNIIESQQYIILIVTWEEKTLL